MQTFLPYRSFSKSSKVLDYKRLGKQLVEAFQIWNIITNKTPDSAWKNHPAVAMWRGYQNALAEYTNAMISEWIMRGYNNNMKLIPIRGKTVYPPWLGLKKFHSSHRAKLLGKDFEYYSTFGWKEKLLPKEHPYYWPRSTHKVT